MVFQGCAVGWNEAWQSWDLRIRRGVLADAELRLVIEHHGGPRRLARLSALIKQTKILYSLQVLTAAFAVAMGTAGLFLPLAVLVALSSVLWLAPSREASRLESAIRSVADEVAAELSQKQRIDGLI